MAIISYKTLSPNALIDRESSEKNIVSNRIQQLHKVKDLGIRNVKCMENIFSTSYNKNRCSFYYCRLQEQTLNLTFFSRRVNCYYYYYYYYCQSYKVKICQDTTDMIRLYLNKSRHSVVIICKSKKL